MCLTTFLNGSYSDHAEYTRKSRLTEDESKRHKDMRFMQMEISCILEKNGGDTPSSLGSMAVG